jgi:hypothetical protein
VDVRRRVRLGFSLDRNATYAELLGELAAEAYGTS